MRILQTIAGLGTHSGGTSSCTYDLLVAMHRMDCDVNLMTLQTTDLIGCGELWIKALPNDSISPYGYSRNINRYLCQSDYDLYHTNGMWMHCNHETCFAARKKGKPYVITPHGMLYPKALKRSYWKKWSLIQLFFNKDIQGAACLHATCKQEMDNIRLFGYQGPVAIISNPADIPMYAGSLFDKKIKAFLECHHPKKFGFLGRLHPIKKVENLLYGMSLLNEDQKAELVIIGKGDDKYEQFLRLEVERLGLKNISFVGFIDGKAKYELLASFSALFVPSDFENFGMIITEALSVGTPVMASLGTPWEELNIHHCGWWKDGTPEEIAQVMSDILNMPLEKLINMGENGMNLVASNYASDKVALKMTKLYKWIVNDGEKPEFVFFPNK
ncbi:glycosyltransferase [Phocaeicola sartorii]|uniref:glycosyltransferase n=1 Tax=Phocaeicola sartorii TaxID=671267 RepID=UPI001F58AE81|nr:glycosyltransferase [Phocaeicola sartorii]